MKTAKHVVLGIENHINRVHGGPEAAERKQACRGWNDLTTVIRESISLDTLVPEYDRDDVLEALKARRERHGMSDLAWLMGASFYNIESALGTDSNLYTRHFFDGIMLIENFYKEKVVETETKGTLEETYK